MCTDFLSSISIVSRALRLVWHLTKGLLMVTVLFRFLKPQERDEITMQWSLKCLRILHVHVRIKGDRPPHQATGILFVANHISWIDVLALNAIRPMCFVAKAEVRHWPFIGQLASRVGTLFFTRRPQELLQVNRLMLSALKRGQCMALFPEGTTSVGQTVLRFHSGLFESAAESQALVWPVALRYYCADGSLAPHAAFVGDQSLISSIHQVLTQPALHLDMSFLPTLAGSQYDRYELAQRTRTAILSTFDSHPQWPLPALPSSDSSIDWSDEPSAAS
jgi:1-acyl-sn-glycerol-3-phosphate acyltransferase